MKNRQILLAEESGWHIGDGSMGYYMNRGRLRGIYQLRGHIDDDKSHYIKRIKPIFEKLYNTKINLREMPYTRVFGFQIWRDNIVKFKQKIGLPLGKKLDVVIPSRFLKNKVLKISVIRGVFDTDGGIYLEKKNNKLYPRLEIKTISFNLSKQLVEILKDLGFRVTCYSNKLDSKRQRCYIITIRGNDLFCKFMNFIKPANPKHFEKYSLYKKSL